MKNLSIFVFAITGLFASSPWACGPLFAGENWSFVAFGDSRGDSNEVSGSVNTAMLAEIVNAIINEDVDFALFSGDLAYGHPGSPENFEAQLTLWRDTIQPLYDAGIGVYPIRGNHETHESYCKDVWDTVFSGSYALPDNGPTGEENITFSFQHENALIVGLDLYAAVEGRHYVNQTWLEDRLASSEQPHLFVFAHEPAFEVRNWLCFGYRASARNVFWQTIAAHGGRTYFCSHDHFYNHARIDDEDGNPNNDLHQFVVGTSGAPINVWDGSYSGDNGYWTPRLVRYESKYGYMLVEVENLNVTITWKRRTSQSAFDMSDVFTYAVSPYTGGAGEPNDPYLIATAQDMNNIGSYPEYWGKCFMLVDDINMADFAGTEYNIIGSLAKPFSGVFDGNGYSVSNFSYTRTGTDYTGLFGYVKGPNALIKDLTLVDPNIDAGTGEWTGGIAGWFEDGAILDCAVEGGSIWGRSDAGGLIGFSDHATLLNCRTTCTVSGEDDTGGLVGAVGGGTISHCYATGDISGNNDTGGLIGDNDKALVSDCYATGTVSGHIDAGGLSGDSDWGTILNCYAMNTVSGRDEIGGLIGENHGGTISHCYAVGDVSGVWKIGGLVGTNLDEGVISNSYAMGSVLGNWEPTGGLLGFNRDSTVSNCYAAASVSGYPQAGGLVGVIDSGTVSACFWDIEVSGRAQSAGGAGKTSAEMRTERTFTESGWDFTDIWGIGENQTYPFLKQHPASDLNRDSRTDMLDLAILASGWLQNAR